MSAYPHYRVIHVSNFNNFLVVNMSRQKKSGLCIVSSTCHYVNSFNILLWYAHDLHLLWGGYGFLFRSEMFFRTTQELEYLFFLSRKARNFFPAFYNRLYDKNSESDYFFFPPPKSEYFFQQHWESEYFFLEKNHNPPFKLNGRSLSYLYFYTDHKHVLYVKSCLHHVM
jgi:hypothetical protein